LISYFAPKIKSSVVASSQFIMPSAIPPWKRPAKTKVDLPWADISVIDISTFNEPGGKQKLAEQLRQAVSSSPPKLTAHQ
jgi:hypothetical protein